MINMLPAHVDIVRAILHKHVSRCEVRVFGSRSTDTVKTYSDLDLVLVGKETLNDDVLYALKEDFQESDLPFRVDVVDWNTLSEEFKAVIEKQYDVIQEGREN